MSANFVGKAVKAGSPLCTLYSQEVYAAQLEFLSVLERTPRDMGRPGQLRTPNAARHSNFWLLLADDSRCGTCVRRRLLVSNRHTIRSAPSLVAACVEAGSKRVRPLLMTVLTNIFGLLPVLLDDGVGADVAKRIAAPMWGGLVSLTLLTLLVIPAIYVIWRSFELRALESRTRAPISTRSP